MEVKGVSVKASSGEIYVYTDYEYCKHICQLCYGLDMCLPRKISESELKTYSKYLKIITRFYNGELIAEKD